ncbi:type II toxin-antitoxin system YhaV family toxin [Wenzhouxiangella sp. XN24]|uniref:type II toxin-antitoxin system YhaV family toxin n=1 Tax=Wenzhouxiangella sp. XN24 TaxID=2713569 RepID=UPI0013EB28D2|nr:type II toxin-antitoxin system YhaV family toxin [Wenzhouxiangella sp. XN24]
MSKPRAAGVAVNGWALFAHPLFLDQLESLAREVDDLRHRDPTGYTRRNAAKRLAAIARLAFEIIPQDPSRSEYRQGQALGAEHKHWFRAKFYQQYRLFFRYQAKARVIVYAWVNDEGTRRACGSADDAYRVFRKMLQGGNPPDNWDQLLLQAKAQAHRMRRLAPR